MLTFNWISQMYAWRRIVWRLGDSPAVGITCWYGSWSTNYPRTADEPQANNGEIDVTVRYYRSDTTQCNNSGQSSGPDDTLLSKLYIWGIPPQIDPAQTLIFFIQVFYWKNVTNFQIFLKISLSAMIEIIGIRKKWSGKKIEGKQGRGKNGWWKKRPRKKCPKNKKGSSL